MFVDAADIGAGTDAADVAAVVVIVDDIPLPPLLSVVIRDRCSLMFLQGKCLFVLPKLGSAQLSKLL